MTTHTVPSNETQQGGQAAQHTAPRWQTIVTVAIILALVIIAIAMRLYNLNKLFDYDGYDEGVYWQSLRAMSAGNMLFGQVFSSQPPFFLLSVYPFYMLLGQSIWAARVGIACISLLGLLGAYLMGKAFAGRVGGIAAMILLIAAPLYLAQSQILQAEAPSTALMLVAVGAACAWWEHPGGRKGLAWAILCGVTLPLSILTKLLGVTAFVPIGLLILVRLWQIARQQHSTRAKSLIPIIAAIIVCLATTLIVLAPYFGSFHAAIQQAISFHTAAKAALIGEEAGNRHILEQFLLANAALTLAALLGAVVALLRRDWRVIPLIAWFVATFAVLLVQVPLFPRHAIALLPPMIGMAVMALYTLPTLAEVRSTIPTAKLAAFLAAFLMLIVIVTGGVSDYGRYQQLSQQANSASTQLEAHIANDIQQATAPGQQVITDEQFIAALANRDVPPFLVDTSMVRIDSGYLTLPQLIQAASAPNVHAVLFYSGRFSIKQVAGFHAWVAQHFHLRRTYSPGVELWVR
jgi:4-amino-4-deoxy-L-arabinose transferase-like glycosyltransferase